MGRLRRGGHDVLLLAHLGLVLPDLHRVAPGRGLQHFPQLLEHLVHFGLDEPFELLPLFSQKTTATVISRGDQTFTRNDTS